MTLQELADRITEAWTLIAEQIEKLAEELRKAFEKFAEEKNEQILRRPPKWYIKANNPAMIVGKSRIFHCRNNC